MINPQKEEFRIYSQLIYEIIVNIFSWRLCQFEFVGDLVCQPSTILREITTRLEGPVLFPLDFQNDYLLGYSQLGRIQGPCVQHSYLSSSLLFA